MWLPSGHSGLQPGPEPLCKTLHACVKVGITGGDADVPPIPETALLVKISRERLWANHGLWGKAARRVQIPGFPHSAVGLGQCRLLRISPWFVNSTPWQRLPPGAESPSSPSRLCCPCCASRIWPYHAGRGEVHGDRALAGQLLIPGLDAEQLQTR